MLSLYRKFPLDAASMKQPKRMYFSDCEIYPNERRELVCKTARSSFVLAEDVYAYYADSDGLWYAKNEDVAKGIDVVYRMNFNNIAERQKGVLDDDNYFLFSKNGYLYCDNNTGDSLKLCSLTALDSLQHLTGRKQPTGIKQLESSLGAECGFRGYSEADFYKDINELHMLVSSLDRERKSELCSSTVSAKIIAKVIKMCCQMNRGVSAPLERIMRKEIV